MRTNTFVFVDRIFMYMFSISTKPIHIAPSKVCSFAILPTMDISKDKIFIVCLLCLTMVTLAMTE